VIVLEVSKRNVITNVYDGSTPEHSGHMIERIAPLGIPYNRVVAGRQPTNSDRGFGAGGELGNRTTHGIEPGVIFECSYLQTKAIRNTNIIRIHAGYKFALALDDSGAQ